MVEIRFAVPAPGMEAAHPSRVPSADRETDRHLLSGTGENYITRVAAAVPAEGAVTGPEAGVEHVIDSPAPASRLQGRARRSASHHPGGPSSIIARLDRIRGE